MRGGGVAVLPNNAPPQVRICGSTQVNGGPVDLAAPGPAPGGGWPLTMNDGRQLNDGLVGPAPIDDQKTRLTNIYKTVNVNNDNTTFDGKIQFN